MDQTRTAPIAADRASRLAFIRGAIGEALVLDPSSVPVTMPNRADRRRAARKRPR